jgi:RNA polymerase sigma-B factor
MAIHPQPVPLTDEQILELIATFQADGNADVQERLVRHYQDLVKTLAYKFVRSSELYEDLVQVGMIGLIASLQRYDPAFGCNFDGFAIPTIIGEIKRHLRDKTWSVHVPRRIKELGPQIKSAVEELTAQLQCSPRVEEVAHYLHVTTEEVLETMEMGRSYQALSLDNPLEISSDGSQVTLLDLVGQEDSGYNQTDLKLLLERIFIVLTKREREILQMTFFANLSQKQVGTVLGISQMHVSRLQRRALQKLRRAICMELSEVMQSRGRYEGRL